MQDIQDELKKTSSLSRITTRKIINVICNKLNNIDNGAIQLAFLLTVIANLFDWFFKNNTNLSLKDKCEILDTFVSHVKDKINEEDSKKELH